MANNKQWPQDLVDKTIKLYKEGKSDYEISQAIGKTKQSTKGMLTKLRKQYNLPYRDQRDSYRKRGQCSEMTEFDKAWHGRVPCGHWMITKPWRKVS